MDVRERFTLWVREYLSDALTVLATLVLAVASIGASYQWGLWIVGSLLLTGVVCAASGILYDRKKHRPTLAALSGENARLTTEVGDLKSRIQSGNLDLLKVVEVVLRDLSDSTGLNKPDTRLSAYRHDQDQFILVGRVSERPEYASVGRRSYPDTQGFISQVWRGTTDKPKITLPSDPEDWKETQIKTYGLSPEEVAGLRMRTLAMCGSRLQRDRHDVAYGVLCIESDRPQATLTATTKAKVEETPQFRLLIDILSLSVTTINSDEARQGLLYARPSRRAIPGEDASV